MAMPTNSASALPVPEAAATATMATPKKPRRSKTIEPATSTKTASSNILMLLRAAAEKAKAEQPAKSAPTVSGVAEVKPSLPPHSGKDSADSTQQSANETIKHPNDSKGVVKKTQQLKVSAAAAAGPDALKGKGTQSLATNADQAKLRAVETRATAVTVADTSKRRTSRHFKAVAATVEEAKSSMVKLVANSETPKETERIAKTGAADLAASAMDTAKKQTSRKAGATKVDAARSSVVESIANTPKETESSMETTEPQRKRLKGKQATSLTQAPQASVQSSATESSAVAGSGKTPTSSKGRKKAPTSKSRGAPVPVTENAGSGQPSDSPAKAACTKPAGETVESGHVQQADAAAEAVSSSNRKDEPFTFAVGSFDVPCCCTRDPDVMDAWARDVSQTFEKGDGAGVLGFDCEWAAPWHRPVGAPDRVATLQLCCLAGPRALVAQVVGLAALPPALAALLADARIAKVGAGAAGDASRMARDFGGAVRGLYDIASMNSGKHAGRSLEALVKAYCPEAMHIQKATKTGEKGVRTSNWEAWPLSPEQVQYAAADAVLSVLAFAYRFDMVSDKGCFGTLSPAALAALSDASEDPAPEKATDASKASAGGKASRKRAASPAGETTGQGEEKKKQAKSGLSDEQKANFFQAMRNKGLSPQNLGKKEHPQGRPDALKEVCIVVSGILDSFERADMEKYVTDHGGSVAKAVTKKVTHLVTDHGEAGPSKLKKCKELGIPIVSEDVILQMVRDSLAAASVTV